MATVNKNFKIKSGLVVEGTTGTINGEDILTKKQADEDYIIALAGGGATSANEANKVVKRDGSGNFAAGTITADLTGDVTGDVTGTVSSLSNHTTDSLTEGTSNEYYTDAKVRDVLTGSTQTNITITEVGNELHITAENGIADSTTDNLTEGTTNKYYSDSLVDAHLSGGNAITYSAGTISVDLVENGGLTNSGDAISIDRTTVDTWYDDNGAAASAQTAAQSYADGLAVNYDAAGAATTAQSNAEGYADSAVSSHNSNTSEVHGVNGDVVGTSDTQTLTNKTIGNTLTFNDGGADTTIAPDGDSLELRATDGQVNVYGGAVNINPTGNVWITSNTGDIVLSADNAAYYGSASAENELATHGYVDNAISGLDWKSAVNLLWNDSNATLTGTSGTLVIDGHSGLDTSNVGYRILITTGANRGIWEYADDNANWTLTRPADADAYSELIGAAVYVMEGTQFGATSWVQGNHYSTSFTDEVWTQFSGSGSVTAGNGIVVDGLEVSIDTSVVATQSDLSTGLGTKQDTLTAGSGIEIDGTTISPDLAISGGLYIDGNNKLAVDGFYVTFNGAEQTLTSKTIDTANNNITVVAADVSDFNSSVEQIGGFYFDSLGSADTAETNANSYTDGEITTALQTAQTYANTAQLNAEDYADGLAGNYEAAGAINTAINALTTDDIEEGTTNHYYTDARAKAEAAALLTNATKTNITITADVSNNLTITAEGGVGDATTDDLVEGETNLYFLDSRAVDAITNSDIRPTTVEIDDYRKEEATRTSVGSTSTANLHSFEYPWESAKYLVRVVGFVGGVKHSQLTEILITKDGSNNIAISEYGTICTDSNNLASFTATEASGVITLTGTTAAVTSCEIITAATLLSWAD